MNTRMFVGDALVEIDVSATKKWYEAAAEWDCVCEDCRRFVKAAKCKKLSDSTLKILQEFEIPPEKATYVCLIDGADLYEYCYRIIGRVVEKIPGKSVVHCTCESEHPCPPFAFPSPHFDIIFYERFPVASE